MTRLAVPAKLPLSIHIVSGMTVGPVIVGLLATHLFASPLDVWPAGRGTRGDVNGGVSNFVATDVDRSRKGDRLCATKPVAKSTIVSKTFAPSELIARETTGTPLRHKKFDVDDGRKPFPSQPVGCESTPSTIGHPNLERLVGRCYA